MESSLHTGFHPCCKSDLFLLGKGNKSRSSLTDEHTLEALLTHEVEDVVGDVMRRFEGAPRLGFAAVEQRLEW